LLIDLFKKLFIMKFLKHGLGIDMAMEKFDVCLSIIDEQQCVAIRAQCSFKNNKKGFETFLGWVLKNTKQFAVPVVYLMEATGIYYEQLAWFLHGHDCTVSVVLPNKAKKYKDALGLKSKTDRIDAKGLAQMACEQNNAIWKPLSDSLYLLRLITRQIQSITEQSTVLKNQLHALHYGMYRDKDIEKMYARQIGLLQKNKKGLELRVKKIVEEDTILKKKFTDICKIKGLGLQSLAVIIAETNGFAAFENVSQLVSYAGYDVVENQSGKRSGKTRISKKGNGHIRRCLHFPAFNMIKYEVAPFKNLYERIYEGSKIKMKGYTAVQKKLLIIIYTLWKKDEAFDQNYQNKTSGEVELESSFASVPKGPVKAFEGEGKLKIGMQKITPDKTRVTQDKHPSKHRRMPSFA
jgi:transposase